MNVACPSCSTVYRVDPAKVPADGVMARCRECDATFRVDAGTGPADARSGSGGLGAPQDGATRPSRPPSPERGAPAGEGPPATGSDGPQTPATPVFGPQDPQTRAQRLARALVSDIKVYNLEKWEASREAGTLRSEFRDEILRSWEEYVEQVGREMAKKTPYFRNALNDILATGERVF